MACHSKKQKNQINSNAYCYTQSIGHVHRAIKKTGLNFKPLIAFWTAFIDFIVLIQLVRMRFQKVSFSAFRTL